MKRHLIIILFFSFIVDSQAQYPKLIIQLKDKGSNAFSISNPTVYLTSRAILRRSRFNLSIDSADLPVSKKYIDSIRGAGAITVLSTSKWLNQILIETTDQNALKKIQNFSFVKSTKGIGYRTSTITTEEKNQEDGSYRIATVKAIG